MSATRYLAGAMTGKENFNYDAFHLWAQRLRSIHPDSDVLINPAENFDGQQDRDYRDYISLAVEQVSECDGLYLMPEWYHSKRGVYVELTVALALGIPVMELKEDPNAVLGWTSRRLAVTADITVRADLSGVFQSFLCVLDGSREPEGYDEQLKEQFVGLVDEALPKSFEQRLEDGYTSAKEFAQQNQYWLTQGSPARKETVLEEAQRIVRGPRQSSYSHPNQDFRCTGRQWGAILENWLVSEQPGILAADIMPDIDPRIVALMMAGLKASREAHKPDRDNRVDGPGYWYCADRIMEGT